MEQPPHSTDAELSRYCFQEWMKLQELDLTELVEAQSLTNHQESSQCIFRGLAQKNIQHFEKYVTDRSVLARADVSPYYAPEWCSSLENSLLWIGGCRPTIFIRCVYALGGSEIDAQVIRFLNSSEVSSSSSSPGSSSNYSEEDHSKKKINPLGEISAEQLAMLNKLQATTIKEEDKLSSRLASLQEDIADQPIALIAEKVADAELVPGINGEVEKALDKLEKAMVEALEEADRLRMNTLKEIITILEPAQGVEFLAGGKKLHLCVHEWGKRRDLKHGRN